MKKILFSVLVLFASAISANAQSDCLPPDNIMAIRSSPTTITFSWDSATEGVYYVLGYVRQSDNYSVQNVQVTGNSFAFSDIEDGEYVFSFNTVCTNFAASTARLLMLTARKSDLELY